MIYSYCTKEAKRTGIARLSAIRYMYLTVPRCCHANNGAQVEPPHATSRTTLRTTLLCSGVHGDAPCWRPFRPWRARLSACVRNMSSVAAGKPLVGLGEASRAVGTGGTSVRVTGRLVEFDTATACALIEHQGEELSIDVSALGGSRMRQGELLQFIGEAFPGRHGTSQPYVRARIVRNVDNLDMQTYEKAVLATRAFIDGLAD